MDHPNLTMPPNLGEHFMKLVTDNGDGVSITNTFPDALLRMNIWMSGTELRNHQRRADDNYNEMESHYLTASEKIKLKLNRILSVTIQNDTNSVTMLMSLIKIGKQKDNEVKGPLRGKLTFKR